MRSLSSFVPNLEVVVWPYIVQIENDSNTLVKKVQNKDTSSKNSENQPSSVTAPEKTSSVTDEKTITKVKSPKSDNQPEKQSLSSDSMKRDRALFFKSLNSNSDNVKSEQ